MRTKKKLENYAQEDLSRYENEDFLESLKANVSEEKAKQRSRRIKRIVFSSVGAALAIAVCVGALLWAPWKSAETTTLEDEPSIETIKETDAGKEAETPLETKKEDPKEERHYLFEDQITEDITLEELNSALKQIHFSSEGVDLVKKAVNTQYDEVLYYTLQYSFEGVEDIKLVLVSNDQYEYAFGKELPYDSKKEIIDCELNFVETFTEDDGLYSFKAKGEMLSEDGMLYIIYSGLGFEETSNFIPLLRSILE